MPESPAVKLSSKYQAFMFDGIVTLYIGPNGKKMEMHKKLLASISPELDKHVNNNMKEGIEGKIHFTEEREEAFSLFSEWAYTGDYTIVDNTPALQPLDPIGQQQPNTLASTDLWPRLHLHLQLYVFSDKFNIPTLKLLAKSNFSKEINIVELTRGGDVTGLTSVIEYAYDNLPDLDPVPKFLARYASWRLGLLRGSDEFIQLVSTQSEFVKEFLVNLSGIGSKPTLTC